MGRDRDGFLRIMPVLLDRGRSISGLLLVSREESCLSRVPIREIIILFQDQGSTMSTKSPIEEAYKEILFLVTVRDTLKISMSLCLVQDSTRLRGIPLIISMECFLRPKVRLRETWFLGQEPITLVRLELLRPLTTREDSFQSRPMLTRFREMWPLVLVSIVLISLVLIIEGLNLADFSQRTNPVRFQGLVIMTRMLNRILSLPLVSLRRVRIKWMICQDLGSIS